MPENKTKPNDASVDAFVASLPDPARRADAEALLAIMARASSEQPFMYGSAIVGFGLQHYYYDSGHSGDMPKIGFSPRKSQMVIYGLGRFVREGGLEALGKHTTGKGCVYFKRLSDLDAVELERLLAEAGHAPSPA